jgi:hypothetical protein
MKTLRYACLALVLTVAVGCARRSVAVDAGLDGAGSFKPGVQVAQDNSSPGFQFPADKSGKLLDEALRPPQKLADEAASTPKPKQLKAPASVEHPEVALTAPPLGMARPALLPKAPPLRPHVLPEDAPLTGYHGDLARVKTEHLPAGAPVRLASPDVNQLPPLPFLATLSIDRASLEDPTSDDSLKTALAAVPPIRTNPAPFVRLNLPDPFENAQTVRPRVLPTEEHSPAAGSPQQPKP